MNGWSAQLSMALAGPAILNPHLAAIDLLCPVLMTAVHCSVRSETMESFGSNRRHLAPFLLYTFPRNVVELNMNPLQVHRHQSLGHLDLKILG